MVLVEKFGQLILVTMEGSVTEEETQTAKKQLKDIAKIEDEAVVSFNVANPDGSEKPIKDLSSYNEIIEFCNKSNIRI